MSSGILLYPISDDLFSIKHFEVFTDCDVDVFFNRHFRNPAKIHKELICNSGSYIKEVNGKTIHYTLPIKYCEISQFDLNSLENELGKQHYDYIVIFNSNNGLWELKDVFDVILRK